VSIGAGTSFRSRRRRSNSSGDSGWGEALLWLLIATVVFLLIVVSVAGIVGYLFGLVYLAARPERKQNSLSAGDAIGVSFVLFAALLMLFAVGVDVGAVIYFLNEGATLSPKDIVLVGIAAGLPLLGFSLWLFRLAFKFGGNWISGLRLAAWLLSAIVALGVPFVIAAWATPHVNDGEDVNPATVILCIVIAGGFIASQFLLHKSVAQDSEDEEKPEQVLEPNSVIATTGADDNEVKARLLQRMADLLSARLSDVSTAATGESEVKAGKLEETLANGSLFVKATVVLAAILMIWPEKHKGLTLLLVPIFTSGISIFIGYRLGVLPFQS